MPRSLLCAQVGAYFKLTQPSARLQSLVLRLLLYGGGGLGAYGADCLVDDDVEELVVVGSGFFLDDLAHALAGSGIVGQAEVALFSGYLGELFDDVEEGFFVLAAEQPGVMDGGCDDLGETLSLASTFGWARTSGCCWGLGEGAAKENVAAARRAAVRMKRGFMKIPFVSESCVVQPQAGEGASDARVSRGGDSERPGPQRHRYLLRLRLR
jgi:hypothetical protein